MKIKISCWFRSARVLALAAVFAGLLAGCKVLPHDSAAAFTSSVATTRTQSQQAFDAINDLVAEGSIGYAASQPHLLETNILTGLDPRGEQAWDRILQALGKYGQHLQALTAPEFTKPFEEEAENLGGELKTVGKDLQTNGFLSQAPQITPALASAFAAVGDLILEARAQAHAQKIARAADPHIGHICQTLADSIGTGPTNGLRGTVFQHWNDLLAEKKNDFLTAPDAAAKRKIAADFAALLQRRAAQDQVLISLQHSLLKLAELHHALANGQSWTIKNATAAIAAEAQRGSDLYNRFNAKLN